MTGAMPAPPHLEARGISKHFGTLKALDDVSIEIAPGAFHALLGENGAGKSTIVKCLMGFHHADAGEILIDRRPTRLGSPREARSHGLGMVFQHFTLIPSMTVAENLVLARPNLPFVIDWTAEKRQLRAFLEKAPFRMDLEARVDTLAAGQKQKVEILKELYLQTRLLILDEPTSVLTRNEADEVLGFVRRLADAKELSVLLITHKFREVIEYSDEVTVLRRGRFAGAGKTSGLDASRMAEMMMGEPRVQKEVARSAGVTGRPVLRIEDLRARGDNGLEVLHGVNLTVREGEIVGIAGVSGNGQRELVEVIAGQRQALSGRITVNGENHVATREMLRRHQFFTLPEEPLRNAAVPWMSVAENMVFGVFDRAPFQRSGFLLDRVAIDRFARELIARFSVRPPSPDAPIGELSGGNVQRAILARELSGGDVRILVAANPCFGLDFKAVDFIHSLLLETRNKGAAVLLVSEDLDELLALADRIFVITEGIVAHETATSEVDPAVIGRQMAGHH
jgi:general nucleoside transport system ATP-binding protein